MRDYRFGNFISNVRRGLGLPQFQLGRLAGVSDKAGLQMGKRLRKEKKLLLDLVNAQGLVDGTTAVESFIQGFRLGARIAIEVMSDEDGFLRDIT